MDDLWTTGMRWAGLIVAIGFWLASLWHIRAHRQVRTIDVVIFAVLIFYALPPVYTPPDLEVTNYPQFSLLARLHQPTYTLVLLFALTFACLGYGLAQRTFATRPSSGRVPAPSLIPAMIALNFGFILLIMVMIPDWRILGIMAENRVRAALLGLDAKELARFYAGASVLMEIGSMAAVVLFAYGKTWWQRGLALFFLSFWIALAARRGILLGWLLMLGMLLYERGRIKAWHLALGGVGAVAFLFAYLSFGRMVQMDPLQFVSGDLGRQRTLAYTLEHTETTRNSILPYRGYAYSFELLSWIPRSLWPGKPMPGNRAYTQHVMDLPVGDVNFDPAYNEEFGFIEESLLNFGLLGIALYAAYGFLFGVMDRVWRPALGPLGVVFIWFAFYLSTFSIDVVRTRVIFGIGSLILFRLLFFRAADATDTGTDGDPAAALPPV